MSEQWSTYFDLNLHDVVFVLLLENQLANEQDRHEYSTKSPLVLPSPPAHWELLSMDVTKDLLCKDK